MQLTAAEAMTTPSPPPASPESAAAKWPAEQPAHTAEPPKALKPAPQATQDSGPAAAGVGDARPAGQLSQQQFTKQAGAPVTPSHVP